MTNLSYSFMKRLAAISIGVLVFLVGCTNQQQEQPTMSPDEVLRNAAQASLVLDSVRYELKGDFTMTDSNDVTTAGTIKLDGALQGAGEQMQFEADIRSKTPRGGGDDIFSATVGVVVGGSQDLYVKLHSFESEGSNPLFNDQLVGKFIGQWWHIPSRENQLASISVTPDPRLLNAQAQVVRVVQDRGMSSLRDRSSYRYDVVVDHDKLLSYLREVSVEQGKPFDEAAVRASIANLEATGEIWIDAETYYVQRLQWDVSQGSEGVMKSVTASFLVDFYDHDSVAPIELPEDALEFTPLMFLDAPSALDTDRSTLPPEIEEDIMKQLLEEGANNPYLN